MLDLDAIEKELPPGSRLGNIGCVGNDNPHISLAPGTWTCTLLSIDSRRGVRPSYAVGYGSTPSIAFARAKQDWISAAARLTEPKPKRGPLPSLTLEDLDL